MSRTKKKKPVDTVGQKLKERAEIKAQIAARVAPAPRPKNVIKKVYKDGSPGMARKLAGVTLTSIKGGMAISRLDITQPLDVRGNPVGEPVVVATRDTAKCTAARRDYTKRGLLGRTKSARRKELRGFAAERTARRKLGKVSKAAPVVAPKKGKR